MGTSKFVDTDIEPCERKRFSYNREPTCDYEPLKWHSLLGTYSYVQDGVSNKLLIPGLAPVYDPPGDLIGKQLEIEYSDSFSAENVIRSPLCPLDAGVEAMNRLRKDYELNELDFIMDRNVCSSIVDFLRFNPPVIEKPDERYEGFISSVVSGKGYGFIKVTKTPSNYIPMTGSSLYCHISDMFLHPDDVEKVTSISYQDKLKGKWVEFDVKLQQDTIGKPKCVRISSRGGGLISVHEQTHKPFGVLLTPSGTLSVVQHKPTGLNQGIAIGFGMAFARTTCKQPIFPPGISGCWHINRFSCGKYSVAVRSQLECVIASGNKKINDKYMSYRKRGFSMATNVESDVGNQFEHLRLDGYDENIAAKGLPAEAFHEYCSGDPSAMETTLKGIKVAELKCVSVHNRDPQSFTTYNKMVLGHVDSLVLATHLRGCVQVPPRVLTPSQFAEEYSVDTESMARNHSAVVNFLNRVRLELKGKEGKVHCMKLYSCSGECELGEDPTVPIMSHKAAQYFQREN